MLPKYVLWLGLFSLILAGCSSGDQPLRIAAFPAQSPNSYHTHLVIETYDIAGAARRASQLANEYGGYTFDQRLTTSAGRHTYIIQISVHATQNEPLRAALAHLGRVVDEWRTSDLTSSPRRIYPEPDTTIELYLRESRYTPLPVSSSGWDPRRTAAQAFAVFRTIFSFVFDILIWAAIVIGPFVLVGWAVWALVRRRKRSPGQSQPDGK
jgi:hypothetical protein